MHRVKPSYENGEFVLATIVTDSMCFINEPCVVMAKAENAESYMVLCARTQEFLPADPEQLDKGPITYKPGDYVRLHDIEHWKDGIWIPTADYRVVRISGHRAYFGVRPSGKESWIYAVDIHGQTGHFAEDNMRPATMQDVLERSPMLQDRFTADPETGYAIQL